MLLVPEAMWLNVHDARPAYSITRASATVVAVFENSMSLSPVEFFDGAIGPFPDVLPCPVPAYGLRLLPHTLEGVSLTDLRFRKLPELLQRRQQDVRSGVREGVGT